MKKSVNEDNIKVIINDSKNANTKTVLAFALCNYIFFAVTILNNNKDEIENKLAFVFIAIVSAFLVIFLLLKKKTLEICFVFSGIFGLLCSLISLCAALSFAPISYNQTLLIARLIMIADIIAGILFVFFMFIKIYSSKKIKPVYQGAMTSAIWSFAIYRYICFFMPNKKIAFCFIVFSCGSIAFSASITLIIKAYLIKYLKKQGHWNDNDYPY